MPPDPIDPSDALLRRARAAADRESRRLTTAVRDALADEADLPDERLRATLRDALRAVLAPIERDLRIGAARRLAEMQALAAAERLLDDPDTLEALAGAMTSSLRNALFAELADSARLDALAAALPAGPPAGDRPSLLVRLADCPEPEVAARAADLLALVGLRGDAPPPLPDALHRPLVWWCAAALRERLGDERRADHALVEAAEEAIAHRADAARVEDAAMRLAEAIGASADELPGLLVETLGDRRPELFAAVLAHASGLDYQAVRAMLVDPAGDRLWLLLRAQDIGRTTIAGIGVALADADARRDLDRFADALDAAIAVSAEDAAAVFAPLALPAAYRDARRALGLR